ncbi:MAG: plastocyanin/azurin family copper-binding protein [Thermoplasmata archaeon]
MRARHLAFVLLATMLIAAILLWAGPGPLVLGQASVTITMRDSLAFEPGSFSVAPGESVSLTLINGGVLAHTFTLFAQANANVPVNDNSALQAYFNDPANPTLVDVDFDGGAQSSATFTAPTTEGTYTFVCMVADHAVGGMHGTLVVTSTPSEDPAPIDPLLIGVVVAVVVIVIAVSAVFILRRRS